MRAQNCTHYSNSTLWLQWNINSNNTHLCKNYEPSNPTWTTYKKLLPTNITYSLPWETLKRQSPPKISPSTKHTGLTDITPFLLNGHGQEHHIMLAESTPENSQVHFQCSNHQQSVKIWLQNVQAYEWYKIFLHTKTCDCIKMYQTKSTVNWHDRHKSYPLETVINMLFPNITALESMYHILCCTQSFLA